MTEVPQHVRDAAKAAFAMHQPGRALLWRVDLNDAVGPSTAPFTSFLFASDDMCVRVDVPRGKGLPRIRVRLEPDAAVVELKPSDPALVLATRGRTLLQLETAPRGLARLLITQGDDESGSRHWQTAWTSFWPEELSRVAAP